MIYDLRVLFALLYNSRLPSRPSQPANSTVDAIPATICAENLIKNTMATTYFMTSKNSGLSYKRSLTSNENLTDTSEEELKANTKAPG